jgi:uncharacterized membrane protein (DUF4010 family)
MNTGVEPFLVAAAIGFLLGLEREHHAVVEREQRPAVGARTMTLVALAGALAAAVSDPLAAVGLGAVGLLVTASYWRTSQEHRGTTSEMVVVVAYLLGVYCQRDLAVAAGAGVAVALLLEQKSRVAHFVRDVVTEVEVDDALRFFAMTLIVLPLLPDRDIDRWGVINPNELWRLVVVLAAIGWVGWVGTRVLGTKRGLVVTGVAGGFVSASATTAVLARTVRSATAEAQQPALAGALAASVSTCVQVVAIVAVVDRALAGTLLWPMLAAALVLVGEVWWISRRTTGTAAGELEPVQRRPLQLTASLVVAAILTATLLVATLLQQRFGSGAAVVTAAVAGLADAHGTALAMASLVPDGDLSRRTALVAIGAALGTNTIVKMVVAIAAGGPSFGRRFAAWLAVPALAGGVGVALAAGGL